MAYHVISCDLFGRYRCDNSTYRVVPDRIQAEIKLDLDLALGLVVARVVGKILLC